MNVRNCRGCRRLFNYIAGPVYCPACKEKLEEKFQEVKAYIRENPGVGIHEVSEACDVETNQIRQWLREDRLELAEGSPIMLNCENCGTPIRSGRFCEKCKVDVTNGFKDVLRSNAPKQQNSPRRDDSNSRMRFLQ